VQDPHSDFTLRERGVVLHTRCNAPVDRFAGRALTDVASVYETTTQCESSASPSRAASRALAAIVETTQMSRARIATLVGSAPVGDG
jgi:hypothetical protein